MDRVRRYGSGWGLRMLPNDDGGWVEYEDYGRLRAELDAANEKLLHISQVINAHYNGDDGELTPGQSAKIALQAIADILGPPWKE